MVSLRLRKKESILNDMHRRFSKIPLILDTDDFIIHVERAVRKLDEVMYNPRSVLFTNASDGLMDVTNLGIDEINAVYYSTDSAESILGGLDLGVGLLPILSSQTMPMSSLDSVIDYLIFKQVINQLQRKMMNTWDYTLLPLTADGKQFLQVRNPGNLFWCEFLPYLDPAKDEWPMFENEYQFVSELVYAYIGYANIEVQAQAAMLGVGKEAATLLSHWETRIKDLVKEFEDSSVINYIA
jgi:hypothetical protein